VVISCGSAAQARACFTLVDDHEMAADPVLEDRDVRRAHADRLEARLIEGLRQRDAGDLFHRGQALGIPIGVVHGAESLLHDAQLVSAGFFRTSAHPDVGAYVGPGPPFRLDGAPPGRPAPRLGADTAAVLGELGIDGEALQALRRDGVIG
jgi:formyl-CoA transferase